MKRLLIAGFGDVAKRAGARLERRFALTRLARRYGIDLDRPHTLALERADALLHCAPPPADGAVDTRTANLLAALEKRRILPARVVYVSTSGVYGDCAGARVDESRPPAPATPRAQRRLDAEQQLARYCAATGASLIVLRAPGIYAADRLPLERIRAGTPLLRQQDDVYTNHIHADDLAAILCRAFEDDAPAGTYNASDDTVMKMGDWFDLLADRHGLPRLPRLPPSELRTRVPAVRWSFMAESRRLDNGRLKGVLGVRLRYPTVHEGLRDEHVAGIDQPS